MGDIYLHTFSAKEYRSQKLISLSPSWPPIAYKHESDRQKIEGKNALLYIIGGFSTNFWYLEKRIVLLEKLSSASLPPSMNMPRPFGRWVTEEKKRNLD